MVTEALFRDDAYISEANAVVTGINGLGGIVLDRTIFYPTGGGQPGDSGTLMLGDGRMLAIATTVKGEKPDDIVHVPAEGQLLPTVGEPVTMRLDWERRFRHMRMHSCLHLLSAVLPYPVTGGQVAADKGRLDFDMDGSPPEKELLSEALMTLIAADEPVTTEWISDAELAAMPDLVKTMAVKPPTGSGRVRLVRIADRDLQPCGGTHVRATGEIGPVAVVKIVSKGKQNRRVSVAFVEEGS
ncbi:MAG: alanyl-tRNA editing protein [Alphaproteobacteria bacterium]